MKHKKEVRMDTTLYPELIDYIFNYCGGFFWEKEVTANKHLSGLAKSHQGSNIMMYKFFTGKDSTSVDEDISELVKDGYESFKIKIATRIFNEHKDKLDLNLCPKCSKIARTPWAKQCRFCFYDWH